MAAWLHDNERGLQLLLRVARQDTLQFRMHGSQSGGQNAKINDTGAASLDKDQPAEIAVARYEDASLLLRDAQQLGVLSLC
jgi:hypothetical protein